jgi:FixJ family two-component response regulator
MPSVTPVAVKRIVVGVDDDFQVRESIESLVESAGFTSLVFPSAEEFLQSGAIEQAVCLITDVRMPGMDGLELQRRVRLQQPKLPVIFISAHCDEQVRRRAFDGGARDFLYKPFDGTHLLDSIDRALMESGKNHSED